MKKGEKRVRIIQGNYRDSDSAQFKHIIIGKYLMKEGGLSDRHTNGARSFCKSSFLLPKDYRIVIRTREDGLYFNSKY